MKYKTISGETRTVNLQGLSNSRTAQPNTVRENSNKGKQTLNECSTFDYTILTEGTDPNKPMVIRGIFQRAGQKNQNGRIYSKEILMREAAKYVDNFINQNRAMGELDHPDSAIVNLQRVSHICRGLTWNGNDLIGEIQVLPTPNGNILKNLLQSGVSIGISSRGLGSVRKNNVNEDVVQDDFELLAFDIVSNPSVVNAGFQLNESVDPTNNTPIIEVKQAVDLYHELLQKNMLEMESRFLMYRNF